MASDGEPTDTALSEAIAESQATIAHAFAGDLETRYMTLKKEKNSLYDSNKKQESQIAELQAQAKSLQNALLERDAELSAVKREKNTLQEQSANREAAEKSQQERMSRMEAEADNLREEIRYGHSWRLHCFHDLCVIMLSHSLFILQSTYGYQQDIVCSSRGDGNQVQADRVLRCTPFLRSGTYSKGTRFPFRSLAMAQQGASRAF